jgi:hypothetical protein
MLLSESRQRLAGLKNHVGAQLRLAPNRIIHKPVDLYLIAGNRRLSIQPPIVPCPVLQLTSLHNARLSSQIPHNFIGFTVECEEWTETKT